MKEVIAILGMQWGDEGKGKIVHAIAKKTNCNLMVRFNGGANAGHTVMLEDGSAMKYNQLPSGCELPGMRSVIANGSIIDPKKLYLEMGGKNIDLILSGDAHIVTQTHINRDENQENERDRRIGTTLTGNGPAYSDKAARHGVQVKGMMATHSDNQYKKALTDCDAEMMNTQKYLRECCISEKGTMILEGAHGWELDIDHGDYPNVTSSSCGVGGAIIGTGIGPDMISKVIGVVKSYSTRVGAGSFPYEMTESEKEHLRENHSETGTVTGRKRRVDWIDVGRVRDACLANGVDSIALTHLDVLQGFDEIKMIDNIGVHILPGFKANISQCTKFSDLPGNVQTFIKCMSNFIVPVEWISVGPKESQLIHVPRIQRERLYQLE